MSILKSALILIIASLLFSIPAFSGQTAPKRKTHRKFYYPPEREEIKKDMAKINPDSPQTIHLSEDEIDFGSVAAKVQVGRTLILTNIGSKDLHIIRSRKS